MDDAMTEYERKRLTNIQRNLEFMKTMGVSSAKMAARTSIGRPKPAKVTAKRSIPSRQSARKSRRLRGEEAQYKLPISKKTMTREQLAERNYALEKKNRRRFAADLYGNAPGGSSDSISSDEQESDLEVDASGLDDIIKYDLAPKDIGRIKNCAKSIAFLPRKDQIVVVYGDTKGNLGFWAPEDKLTGNRESSVVTHKLHEDFITQICFNLNDESKLVSASYDGAVKEFDLQGTVSTELYRGDSKITSMTFDNSHYTYLFSCEDGNVVRLDQRDPKTKETSYKLHEKKINTVHHHPLLTHCMATASLDRTTKLWDLRHMKETNTTPVATMPHYRNVNCAYFSPNGAHLVTVGQDNFLHIYDTRTLKFLNPEKVSPKMAIPHSSRIGEHFDKLYVSWDPKNTTRFVIGSLQTPRRLQIFDAARMNPVQELFSNLFKTVHSINVFHPTQTLIASGSATQSLCLWRGI